VAIPGNALTMNSFILSPLYTSALLAQKYLSARAEIAGSDYPRPAILPWHLPVCRPEALRQVARLHVETVPRFDWIILPTTSKDGLDLSGGPDGQRLGTIELCIVPIHFRQL
jgi:hypothetical protein